MKRTHAAVAALRTALAASTAMLFVTGCQSLSDGAKETFSKENTCPPDRVEVRERPEIKTSTFQKPSAPPADIAADPGRLSMWQKEQADRRARVENDGHRYAQARGCGKTVLYNCRGPTNEDRPQRPWFCSEVSNVPDAISKW